MKSIFLFTLCCIGQLLWAQTTSTLHTKNKKSIAAYKQAELLQQQRRFNDAINLLDQVIKKDPTFPEPYFKIGGMLLTMGNKASAKAYFCKGADILPNEKSFAGAYFTAGELCWLQGEYENAKVYFNRAIAVHPNDKKIQEQGPLYLKRCDFALDQLQHPIPFTAEKLPPIVNAFYIHSHPVLSADQKSMVFTARKGVGYNDDENMYWCTWNGTQWSAPVSISDKINTLNNEGTCTMSLDGSILVFVGCSRKDGLGDCDLYISRKIAGEWSTPQNLGSQVNSNAWDSHPSLSSDGRTLYFTSGRAGGYGSADIYVSYALEDGTWSKAKNLGNTINSKGSETSPFWHASGDRLYFTSDYHLGMGSDDLFYSEGKDTSWTTPVNLGYPINTHLSDGTLYITIDNKKGYFSRFENQNNYTSKVFLYSFDLPKAIQPPIASTYAQGHIYDLVTKKPLSATIELIDLSTQQVIQKVSSDAKDGTYTIVITEGKEYGLYITKSGYLYESLYFDYKEPVNVTPVSLDAYLKPAASGANITLNNIFFDVNSVKLQDKSTTELNKLIAWMKENPNVRIELGGHTDNVGNELFNKNLSLNRAKAVSDYLISQGISAQRLVIKGYGAGAPVADNTTDDGRARNRRLEIKIL
ncbi:MAG: OmpA family protein [Cytophagaceae bacterium]|jgi:outer membrane protein OmpA-like peptidoglycan-associated protein/Tol biopolymer transport system component|nr:OmpA family protein [Cytophagaceae bacterium]